ncbi:MAG: hypothetical protein QF704_09500 [Anaerolineales bacterium]|nr:hypothetical protein [Anaerolineales bacterium]
MSTLKLHNIEPATGTDVALGAAGDSITVSGDSLKLDTFKDAGGNTLFTSDGSGTLSSVNSGLKGAGPILIQSQTASNSASISFTSGLDNTYDKYMFVFLNINPATDDVTFGFQCSTDGGSSYGMTVTSTYFRAWHSQDDASTGLTYDTNRDIAQGTGQIALTDSIGSDSDQSSAGELFLFSPSSTSKVKHFYSTGNSDTHSNHSKNNFGAGYINDASNDIDAIKFYMSSGNFDGKIKMYGIV